MMLMTTKKQTKVSYTQLLIIVAITLQLLIILLAWRQNQRTEVLFEEVKSSQAYAAIGDSLYAEPIINASEKRAYLDKLALYLPMSYEANDLLYRVTDAQGGGTIDVVFASQQNVSIIGIETEAATQCNELVRVEIGATRSQPRTGEIQKEPFELNDGRKVFVYLSELSTDCKQSLLTPAESLESVVRQLRSY